jgi:hypothetical protein
MSQTISWQGTDYIKKRLVLVNIRLSFVTVPMGSPLPLEKALKYVEEASELYDWLSSMKPPPGRSKPSLQAKRWAEHELLMLGKHLERASEIVKKRAETEKT